MIGGWFGFLFIYIDSFSIFVVSFYEYCSLNEYIVGIIVRVIDCFIKRFYKGCDKFYDRMWSVKFFFFFVCVD